MFKELAPLVRHRALVFTVRHVEEDQFRVNVIPKKVADGDKDTLTTPASMAGTVEDFDRDLPQTPLHFVSGHLANESKQRMEEVSKPQGLRPAERSREGPATRKDSVEPSNKPAAATEVPAPAKAKAPKAASLFRLRAPTGLVERFDQTTPLPDRKADA